MRKTIAILSILMCFASMKMFAQEVRGVETKRAVYNGESYELHYTHYGRINDVDYTFGTSTEYYGFEFTNLNSIAVSVSIEVYNKSGNLIDTKEIVLKSQESYIHKYPVIQKYYDRYPGTTYNVVNEEDSDAEKWSKCQAEGKNKANEYYVKYKAYKLQ